MSEWWHYDELESGLPYDWSFATQGDNPYDLLDFHLDIGCGTLKKGRLGIDRHPAPGVDLLLDLETLEPIPDLSDPAAMRANTLYGHMVYEGHLPSRKGLPFPDSSIESIISHHCMEHLFFGFIPLIDDCFRVLKPGGILRIITPLFPSRTAVEDPDHKRMILEGTFETFMGQPDGGHWHEAFSVPYTKSRFEVVDKWTTTIDPPLALDELWGPRDVKEIRVALRKP